MHTFFSDEPLRQIMLYSIFATILGYGVITIGALSQNLDPLALTGDSRGYVLLAEHIRHHQSFALSATDPIPESFRTPGFPLFLALLFSFFGVSLVALFVHALLMSAAPVFLYLLFRDMNPVAAWWGALLFIFEPVRLFLASSFLSDAFFVTLFLASLYALKNTHSERGALVVGVLLGLLILVRPVAVFLPLLYIGYVFISSRTIAMAGKAAIIMSVASLFIITPWMYRNHVLFDSWQLSSVGSANLALYNAPEFAKWKPSEERTRVLESFFTEHNALPQAEALSLTRATIFTETFLRVIQGNEWNYGVFHVLKTIPFFISDGLRDTVRLFNVDVGILPNLTSLLFSGDFGEIFSYLSSGGLAIALLVVGSGFWGVVTVLFLGAAIHALLHRVWFTLFLCSLVFYFALLTGPVSNARYRAPVAGIMIVLAVSVALFAGQRYSLIANSDR